jgi:hypothetical protein
MGPLEDMPEEVEEEESDVESVMTEVVVRNQGNPYYRMVGRKRYAELGDAAPAAAAEKIQSIIRMFLARSSYLTVKTSLWVVNTSESYLVGQRQTLRMDISRMRVGRVAWSVASATLIQALWRGFRARETVKDIKIRNSVGIKKFQALWRGYYLRKLLPGEHCSITITHDGRRTVTT